MKHPSPLAVLFFSRAPLSEAKHKRLQSSKFENEVHLFQTCIRHVASEVHACNFPLICSVDEPSFFESNIQFKQLLAQNGANFSERFYNAINDAFALGYDELIVVGNDSPSIDKNHFLDAKHALSQKELVLGESQDGGVYLIAIRRESWEKVKSRFQSLRWQSSFVLNDLCNLCKEEKLSLLLLERLSEIDHVSDLSRILKETSSEELRQAIWRVLHLPSSVSSICDLNPQPDPQFNLLRFQKAPPSLA